MLQNFKNTVHLEGILYDANLEQRVTGAASQNPGTPYIRGSISVATDIPDCLNIVEVHFRYVTAKTKAGKDNVTFGILNNIINGTTPTMMQTSFEEASYVIINNSALALNDFYSTNGNQFVSVMRSEGGYVNIVNKSRINERPDQRNQFCADMLINGIEFVEANPDNNMPEFVRVKGAIFPNFGEVRLLPWTMVAKSPDAQNYFLGLSETVSTNDPIILNVRGEQVCTTFINKIEDESAFGTYVREVPVSRREYVITSAAVAPMDFGSEEVMTKDDLKKLISDRNLYLAGVKKNAEDYKNQTAPSGQVVGFTATQPSPDVPQGTNPAINTGDYLF